MKNSFPIFEKITAAKTAAVTYLPPLKGSKYNKVNKEQTCK